MRGAREDAAQGVGRRADAVTSPFISIHILLAATTNSGLGSDCRTGPQACIRGIFTTILYPALVVVIFVTIFAVITMLITRSSTPAAKARRITAALLPVVVLIYRLVTVRGSHKIIDRGMNGLILGLLGLALGLLFIELGRALVRSDSEAAIPFYILLLSSLGSFMTYFTIQGTLERVDSFLFPFVIAAGLDIVFRGTPSESKGTSVDQ
jgi:hypothetical protein